MVMLNEKFVCRMESMETHQKKKRKTWAFFCYMRAHPQANCTSGMHAAAAAANATIVDAGPASAAWNTNVLTSVFAGVAMTGMAFFSSQVTHFVSCIAQWVALRMLRLIFMAVEVPLSARSAYVLQESIDFVQTKKLFLIPGTQVSHEYMSGPGIYRLRIHGGQGRSECQAWMVVTRDVFPQMHQAFLQATGSVEPLQAPSSAAGRQEPDRGQLPPATKSVTIFVPPRHMQALSEYVCRITQPPVTLQLGRAYRFLEGAVGRHAKKHGGYSRAFRVSHDMDGNPPQLIEGVVYTGISFNPDKPELLLDVVCKEYPRYGLQMEVSVSYLCRDAGFRTEDILPAVHSCPGADLRRATKPMYLLCYNDSARRWDWESEVSQRPLSSIVIEASVMQDIVQDMTQFLSRRNTYAEKFIPYRRSYLFHGPPGTGKTSLIRALLSHFNVNMLKGCITGSTSDKCVREMYAAHSAFFGRDSFMVVEEIDRVRFIGAVSEADAGGTASGGGAVTGNTAGAASSDGSGSDGSGSGACAADAAQSVTRAAVTVSTMLDAMDGVSDTGASVFIYTANNVHMLDKAILRRMHRKIYLGPLTSVDLVAQICSVIFETLSDVQCTQVAKVFLESRASSVTANNVQSFCLSYADASFEETLAAAVTWTPDS